MQREHSTCKPRYVSVFKWETMSRLRVKDLFFFHMILISESYLWHVAFKHAINKMQVLKSDFFQKLNRRFQTDQNFRQPQRIFHLRKFRSILILKFNQSQKSDTIMITYHTLDLTTTIPNSLIQSFDTNILDVVDKIIASTIEQ